MMRKSLYILACGLATLVAFLPLVYWLADKPVNLLRLKPDLLLKNALWTLGFYTHISFGGLALLTGWPQFHGGLRNRYRRLHRYVGTIYVGAVILSAIAGLGIGWVATGGPIAASGFLLLGSIWLSTTLLSYRAIRKGQVNRHRTLMMYSYAACFGAVTLRLWMPLLMVTFGDFVTAYRIVAWLSWVPNLLVAHWLVRKRSVSA
ncbi:MAG: DUF2306 domain-containing protein [Dyadobacter sp.]|uniref:DUF2306 domain-containing protein n=1 Tax=Dyadobacter sp. TaxID=1914288 RepID=UPI0032665CBF